MGRTVNSTNLLRRGSAPVTVAPLTLAIWAKPASFATNNHYSLGLWDSAVNGLNSFSLAFDTTGAMTARASNSGSTAVATTSTTGTAGTWMHMCGVFASSTDRRAFLNGGGKGTNSTSIVPAPNRTTIGARDGSVTDSGLGGPAAEAAIWNIALSDADVAALAAGASPLMIHPEALVFYVPIWGQASPEQDYFLAAGMPIAVGSPADSNDHPPVFRAA